MVLVVMSTVMARCFLILLFLGGVIDLLGKLSFRRQNKLCLAEASSQPGGCDVSGGGFSGSDQGMILTLGSPGPLCEGRTFQGDFWLLFPLPPPLSLQKKPWNV